MWSINWIFSVSRYCEFQSGGLGRWHQVAAVSAQRRERRPLHYASPSPNIFTPIFGRWYVFLDLKSTGDARRKISEMPCSKEAACVRARAAKRRGGRALRGRGVGGGRGTSVFAALRWRCRCLPSRAALLPALWTKYFSAPMWRPEPLTALATQPTPGQPPRRCGKALTIPTIVPGRLVVGTRALRGQGSWKATEISLLLITEDHLPFFNTKHFVKFCHIFVVIFLLISLLLVTFTIIVIVIDIINIHGGEPNKRYSHYETTGNNTKYLFIYFREEYLVENNLVTEEKTN